MFDATKDEMEEKLRTTTEDLNKDLEEFGNCYLEAFNYFDKKTHMLNYVQVCIYVSLIIESHKCWSGNSLMKISMLMIVVQYQ